jgi:pyrroloquinoline quinone (PQQ) biosynthesis protein C
MTATWGERLEAFDWSRTEPYPTDGLLVMAAGAIDAGFYGTRHPLARRWLSGDLTREQLQFLALQEYWYFRCTVWWNAGKVLHAARADQPDLLGPLLEEAGLADDHGSHEAQFVRYMHGLGVTVDDARARGLLPTTMAAVDVFFVINSHGHLVESLAANNLVAETMRPRQYPLVLRAFKNHYRWMPPAALQFFRTHCTADVAHAELGVRLFKKYATSLTAQRRAWAALTRSLAARWAMYDGILAHLDGTGEGAPLLPVWDEFPHLD